MEYLVLSIAALIPPQSAQALSPSVLGPRGLPRVSMRGSYRHAQCLKEQQAICTTSNSLKMLSLKCLLFAALEPFDSIFLFLGPLS